MLNEGARVCDICESEIERGTKYRKVTMTAESAALFTQPDYPDLVFSWTTNQDGTISMDICLTSTISMGGAGEEQTV